MMKKLLTALLVVQATFLSAQVSPYALSPQWYFGLRWGLSFPNGNFPSSGAPTPVLRPATINNNNETSTSICYTSGAIALYSNSLLAFNSANTTTATYIRDFRNAPGDNTCGGSSSGGAVAFPNPAALDNQFYLYIGNDQTGGACSNRGSNAYLFQTTAGVTQYLSGPIAALSMTPTSAPTAYNLTEAIAAGTDGVGGYWLITHNKNSSNSYHITHFLANGTTAGPVTRTWGTVIDDNGGLSAIKISPCQDKIAYAAGSRLDVFNWNRATGTVGTAILQTASGTIPGGGPGGNPSIEWSADGTQIYWSSGVSSSDIYRVNLATGTSTAMGTTNSWTMMLGPDGNIYNTNTTNVKVITGNNGTTPANNIVATPAGASMYQGLINLAFLSPRTATITPQSVVGCDATFSFNFDNYFGTDITIKATGATIDFGDGVTVNNPTFPLLHTYPSSGGPYTVTYTFNDQYCNQTWSAQTTVNPSCPNPVSWFDVDATPRNGGVDVYWATAMEENTSHFIVQRSADGRSWEDLGTVNAAGNSHSILEYGYVDPRPYSGTSYYRIVQYDLDGKHSNSRAVTVAIGSVYMNVYPNPSTGEFNIEMLGAGQATFVITDALGRVVYEKSFAGESISTQVGASLAPGTYILTVNTNEKTYHQKLVKQ